VEGGVREDVGGDDANGLDSLGVNAGLGGELEDDRLGEMVEEVDECRRKLLRVVGGSLNWLSVVLYE
jgi:hypothetical protein